VKKDLILPLMLLLFTLKLAAQDRQFSISTNVANLVFAGPSLALGYQTKGPVGFLLYGSAGQIKAPSESLSYKFKTVSLDARYLVLKYVYLATYLRYIEKQIKRDGYIDNTGFWSVSDRDFKGQGIAGGFLFGLTLADTKRLNLEAYGGPGYGRYISSKDVFTNDPPKDFLDVRAGLLVGIKF
jgi:hypothetical protein